MTGDAKAIPRGMSLGCASVAVHGVDVPDNLARLAEGRNVTKCFISRKMPTMLMSTRDETFRANVRGEVDDLIRRLTSAIVASASLATP